MFSLVSENLGKVLGKVVSGEFESGDGEFHFDGNMLILIQTYVLAHPFVALYTPCNQQW